MTKSSTPPTSDLPVQEPIRQPSSGFGRALLVFIFRLLLLGVGGSLALLIGVAIAYFFPSQVKDPPLLERILQGSQSLLQNFNQSERRDIPPPTTSVSPSPESPAPTEASPQPSAVAPPLTEADRQQVQTELNRIQAQLQQLDSRAAELESLVGTSDPTAPLEERLQTIQRQLTPNAVPPPNDTQTGEMYVAPAATISDGNLLMVTLPSDALFETNQTMLRSGTDAILDTIITDLQRYPGATIRLIGHTDNQGSAEGDRTRAFDQATAVERYLAGKLGEEDYHWVVISYGSSEPLPTDSTTINPQRNRRIEIVIDPN
ncbi:MAG: OmpA family protein [Cyanobacteria bacterium CRU_2_1]|nr:OmpA family protein [Cyanobacteria bacterium RU_5_0]NJR59275.1 OmpA family protein [Cyanobacteria bacterium CRU_2_1]